MTGEVFLDTNVLVYAYDRAEPAKQAVAAGLLGRVVRSGAGVISAQVLFEFFHAATCKIAAPLTPAQAHERVENVLRLFSVVPVTDLIVLEAARAVRTYQMSLWDAQIWAAAKLNQIPIILSEDFSDGLVLEGIRIVDPFSRTFRIEDWL